MERGTNMDEKIEVSIIVPLYNLEDKIGRCLDSLVRQTLSAIEILVVDDGSKDHGADVVREYQKKDKRIRLVSQENRGLGGARNTGIRESKGEYLGFVDSDDVVEQDMYEIMLNAVRKTGSDVAVCQEKNVCYEKDGTMRVLSETRFPCEKVTAYSGEQVLGWFLNYRYLSLNSACFKLVKKTVFTEHKIAFPEQHRYAEDLPTSGGIYSVVNSIAVVPKSLYFYIHETGTLSTSYTEQKAEDVYQDMIDVLHYLKKAGYQGKVDNFILGMSFSSMRQLYGSNNKEEWQNERAKKLLLKWKKRKKKARPSFKDTEIPLFHKAKVLVAYFNLERLFCNVIKMLERIPFFRYMV